MISVLTGKKMPFQFCTFSELKSNTKIYFHTQLHELHTFGMVATPNTSLVLFIMEATVY